jgi:hypothetical protein
VADRVLLITWREVVRGREERALETWNEVLGMCGRMQQDGRIESFDVVLLDPNGELGGYLALKGSAAQIGALDQDEEFLRHTVEAGLMVDDLRHTYGYTNEGVARMMQLYQEAVSKVPQLS